MKTLLILKTALGGGAAILLSGLLAAAPAAQASTGRTLPCDTPALIAAINAANSGGGATINLAPKCTYKLTTAASPNTMLGDTGLPVITSRITLNGYRTTIAGNDSTFRILMVTGSGKLTLQGLTITGGNTPGPGGGIFNLEGMLVLNHTRITGNSSAGGMMSAGGGIASGTLGTGPTGTAVLNFSRVDHNTTSGSAGGILNHAGSLFLNGSKVDDNTAAQGGGGIASGTGGMGGPGSSILVVSFSQVEANTANGGPMAGAGGIANGGTATITGSEVEGNTAPGGPGGGILNHGVMTIKLTQVTGNTAPADSAGDQGIGGGIANINLGPVAPGAVNGGILTITFSQISRNTASGQGGGIFEATITSSGPTAGGPLTLKFSQVTRNQAAQGGGIFAVPGSPVTLIVTVIAKNIPDNCFPAGTIRGCKD
ncbi:MAG TPA: hypothetical protein VF060_15260 [Trebonia sp.]